MTSLRASSPSPAPSAPRSSGVVGELVLRAGTSGRSTPRTEMRNERTRFPALSRRGLRREIVDTRGRERGMADAPSRWRGLGTAPTEEDQTPAESKRQDFDQEEDDDQRTKPPGETSQDQDQDLQPPRARAFIDRGRGVYANMRIKMPLEAGPRHPLVSHWSGKKGA